MNLLDTWARWRPRKPPLVLDEDREILFSDRSAKHLVTYSGWRDALVRPDFGAPDDRRLHLGLLPTPFVGSLLDADIYVLLLNPGLGPMDYFGAYERREFRMPPHGHRSAVASPPSNRFPTTALLSTMAGGGSSDCPPSISRGASSTTQCCRRCDAANPRSS